MKIFYFSFLTSQKRPVQNVRRTFPDFAMAFLGTIILCFIDNFFVIRVNSFRVKSFFLSFRFVEWFFTRKRKSKCGSAWFSYRAFFVSSKSKTATDIYFSPRIFHFQLFLVSTDANAHFVPIFNRIWTNFVQFSVQFYWKSFSGTVSRFLWRKVDGHKIIRRIFFKIQYWSFFTRSGRAMINRDNGHFQLHRQFFFYSIPSLRRKINTETKFT